MTNLNPGETLRVLLVGATQEMRDEVDHALVTRAGDYRIYWTPQAELAAVRAQDVIPQIILVDDELGHLKLTAMIKQLLAAAPGAAIVALLSDEALGEARQALLAGARTFVTKPLAAEELWNTIHQLITQRHGANVEGEARTSSGRVVVFCGPKGGTGRTTMTVNTAISLHQQSKKRVALVDADFSAPALDVVLNLHEDRDLGDLLSRMSRLDEELVTRVLSPHASGLQVLLAPPPAAVHEPISLPQVQQVVAHLKRMFDWVFVDLGLPMDETAFAFLDGADRIVLSVLPEMVGLRNTRLMLDQLHSRGYPEEKTWLVLNRATIRGGVSQADIEKRLRVRVRHSIPDDQPLASHSVNRGVPLVMSHERSAVARAMRELAKLLIQDATATRTATAKKPAPAQPNPLLRLLRRVRPASA